MRISDWSSDVYSSDLNVMIACTHTHSGPDTLNWYAFAPPIAGWWMEWLAQMVASTVYLALHNVDDCTAVRGQARFDPAVNRRRPVEDRKSVVAGKRVAVRVDPGGRRSIKKKKQKNIISVIT